MSRYISVGIDVGSHYVRVAVAESVKNKPGFKIIGGGEAVSEGVQKGYIVNPEETVASIKKAVAMAEKNAGVRIRRALVSIGGIGLGSENSEGSVIISRVDGEVTPSDVEKLLSISQSNAKFVNKKIIHRLPLSYTIDGQKVLGRPEKMTGMKLEAKMLFVTSINQHFDNLVHAIESADIEVEDVVASPLAASLMTLKKTQRTAGCILVNIGSETVSVAVFENDYLIALHVFPIGSTNITNDIALGLRVSLEEAEDMKTENIINRNYSKKDLDEIIEARLRDIFDLVQSFLKKLGKSELLPAGIVITGGGARITTIEEIAKSSLKLPARVATSQGMGLREDDTMWSVAYGLCLLGMDAGYQSDFFQIDTSKIKGHLRGVLSWGRQFLP